MEMYDTKRPSSEGTITLNELEILVARVKNRMCSGEIACNILQDYIREIRVDRYGDSIPEKAPDIYCPHCEKKVLAWKWHEDARFTPQYICRKCFQEFTGNDSRKAVEKIVEAIRELENKIL